MSEMTCSKCGGQTNSAVCDWRSKDKVVVECYAKVENGVWVKGCGYANCNPYTVGGVDSLLGKSAVPSDAKEFDFGITEESEENE